MKKSLFIIFMILVLAASAYADDFYVSPSGTSNPSCSLLSPCRQIRDAIPLTDAGDTVHVSDGSYLGFDVPFKTGTSGAPITIHAEGNNVTVTPTSDRPDNRDNIFITNSDWIVVDGLKTFNAPRAGLRVDQSHSVTVENGTFGNNTTWGIFTNHSNDLVIQNNEAFGSKDQHGIYVSNSGDRPTVRGNVVHDNAVNGIQVNADLSSGGGRNVAPDGIITGALVEKNVVYSNGARGGSGINLDGVQDSIIRNNVLYDNHASGIAAFVQDGAAGPKNDQIYNNTIDMATDSRWALRIVDTAGTVEAINNILYNRNTTHGGISLAHESSDQLNNDVANLVSNHNIFDPFSFAATPNDDVNKYKLPQWQSLFNKDLNSFTVDPSLLFVDMGNRDYRLAPSSPAIDAGIALAGVPDDILNVIRPQGQRFDIGAFEALQETEPGVVIPEPATALLMMVGLGVWFAKRSRLKIN